MNEEEKTNETQPQGTAPETEQPKETSATEAEQPKEAPAPEGEAAAAQGGSVIVKGMRDAIRNIFMMTGFLNLFQIEA